MKWSFTMWIFFAGFTFITVVNGLDIKETLPDHLRECYNDTQITTRENLLPFTVNTFISIIRKLEESFTNDMRVLSSAVSHRYRYDGVQRNPNMGWSDVVIPFSPVGTEFKLYKVLFEKFMHSTQIIPNNTLTYKERCTLHYMLSSSIEPTIDDCSKISQYSSSNHWGNIRFPRAAVHPDPDAEVFDPHGPADYGRQSGSYQGSYPHASQCPLESGVIYNKYGSVTGGIVLAGIAAGLQPENVNVRNLLLVSPRLRRPVSSGGRQPPPYGSRPSQPAYGGRIAFNPQQQPGGYKPGGGSGYQPGGGSGYQPGGGYGGGGSYGGGYGGDTIDNRYAATLSGLLAQISLLLGPSQDHSSSNGISMSGGWNDTAIPKYYFVRDYFENGLTDAKLRGGIDGLLLAKEVNKWSGSGSLKLSQVLGMYYSDRGLFGTNLKACSRRDHVDEIAQSSELKDSAFGFALVLQDFLPESVTIAETGILDYVHMFTDNVISYIGNSMSDKCLTDARTATTYTPTPAVDLHVVIDSNYDYRDISKIVTYIVDNIEVNKYSSNFSLINGNEGKVIVDSAQSPLDVYGNFTLDTYNLVNKGFDFDKLLSGLRLRFQSKLRYDQSSMSGGGIGRVVLFIPLASANFNNKESLIEKVKQFRVKVPDAKFIFLASGAKEKYTEFVEEPNKDIFMISVFNDIAQTLDPVIKRISETPRRLINPNCGPYWSGSWYSPVTVKGYLQKPEVNYYRVHPNYFYKDASARVTFKNDDGSQTLTVCTSRKPIIANTSQNTGPQSPKTCKQLTGRNSLDFSIKSDDCPNSYATSCDPYYFSVSTDNVVNPAITVSCSDPDCKYPDMIKYSVEHQGLTCYSGGSTIFGIPILVLLLYSITLLR